MSVDLSHYGTVQEANEYFDARLHATAWTDADPNDRPKALRAATQIIDQLNFKGFKHPVYELLEANPLAEREDIRKAEASQALEFPRGTDTGVPEAIRKACYELAYSILDGKDPEMEIETLAVVSQGYASVRTTYERSQVPIEHLINGVPNPIAWRWIKPFLRDEDALRLSRVS